MFQASLCLVIYNILQVVRGYAAQAGPEAVKVNEWSTEVLPCADRPEVVEAQLRTLLKQAWTPSWKKAKPSKPRSHPPKAKQSGAYTSVHKSLQEARQKQQDSRISNLNC